MINNCGYLLPDFVCCYPHDLLISAALRRFCAQSWIGCVEVPGELQAQSWMAEVVILQVRLVQMIRHKLRRYSITLT